MATEARFELVGESVGTVAGPAAWFGSTPPRPIPNYTDTMDSGTLAGGGDVVVSPAELDRYTANLQEYVAQIAANVDFNQAQLARSTQTFVLGPQIRGVARAVETAGETSDHLMRTLLTFHQALSHDVAAVQAARQSYVGTDDFAAQNISAAGGDA